MITSTLITSTPHARPQTRCARLSLRCLLHPQSWSSGPFGQTDPRASYVTSTLDLCLRARFFHFLRTLRAS